MALCGYWLGVILDRRMKGWWIIKGFFPEENISPWDMDAYKYAIPNLKTLTEDEILEEMSKYWDNMKDPSIEGLLLSDYD